MSICKVPVHSFCKRFASTGYFGKDNLLNNHQKETCAERISQMMTLRSTKRNVNKKLASVLIPLCVNHKDEVCLLFTKRSRYLRSHSGQVSFPGGIADSGDDDDEIRTAVREMEEEVGIKPDDIEIWSPMKPVGDATGRTAVTPIIGQIKTEPLDVQKLKINPEEVETVFLKSIEELCQPEVCQSTQFRIENSPGYSLPVYNVEPFRIWGMTAIITYQFLSIFVDREHFKHKLIYTSPIKV